MTAAAAPIEIPGPLPDPSANGSAPPRTAPQARPRTALRTKISSMRTALIVGTAVLAVALIFVIQNAHSVDISFLGAHLHLSLAVALMLAAIGGALVMAAAGTARITELRQVMRRDRRKSNAR